MNWLIAIAIIALTAETMLSPRLGFTREGSILLWYGKTDRKYIRII